MCDSPFYVDAPLGSGLPKIPVPCGKCPKCSQRRISSWVYRLEQEERVSSSSYFVTLTYDTQYVPITPRGFMTLQKRDCQLFMKRLRKLHDKDVRIKYYLAGEYGTKTWRPHYHAIIFNADLEKIHEAWQLGAVHIGSATGASARYTAKYMQKGKRVPAHKNDDRIQEFSLMSKRLGSAYLTSQKIAYHKADLSRNYVTVDGGAKLALPRYYREKIYDQNERKAQARMIGDIVTQDDLMQEADFYRRYPDGDYHEYKEKRRVGRWERHLRLPDKDGI